MKTTRVLFLVTILLVTQSVLAQDEVKFPIKVTFLSTPIGSSVRMTSAGFEVSNGGSYSPLALPSPIEKIGRSGTANEFILGTPAVVTEYGWIDARSINNENHMATVGAIVDGKTILVVEKRVVVAAHDVETHYLLFSHDGGFAKMAEFKLAENPYNLYLDNAYPVGKEILAIILSGSRQPYVNAIMFFDVRRKVPLGFREFSEIQYLPETNSIWIAPSVVNCENLKEALADAVQHALTVPILKNGKLNTELSEMIELVRVSGD